MLAGAAVVHEGRVLSEGHGGLTRDPHHAVPMFLATALVLGMVAAGRFAGALKATGGAGPAAPVPVPATRALWLACAGELVAIHLLQETIEGGLGQSLAPATLVAVACALVVGFVLAVLLRGAERLIVRRSRGRRARPRPTASSLPRAPRRIVVRSTPLARHLAGRAPPVAV